MPWPIDCLTLRVGCVGVLTMPRLPSVPAAPKGMEIIHLQVTAHGIVGFVCLVDPIALVSLHATPHRCWLLLHALDALGDGCAPALDSAGVSKPPVLRIPAASITTLLTIGFEQGF